jgi:type II secretory pathway pseudopilin PulG
MTLIHRPSRSAFTLTELMISIALAIILIVGINAVFKSTSDTLSAGQKIAEANRNEQSLQTVLADDIRQIVLPEEAPFLLIRSRREPGFLNAQDQASDLNYDATSTNADTVDAAIRSFDPDQDGTETTYVPAVYNRRNHRIDTLRFFARGLYARQTGSTAIVDHMAAREAFITYGHVMQPVPGTTDYRGLGSDYEGVKRGLSMGVFVDPTAPRTATDNPLNFYVQNWTLGRAVMLLARAEDTNSDGQSDVIYDTSNATNQVFIKRKATEATFNTLAPLSINSEASSGGNPYIQWTHYDLGGTTMDAFRWILAHADQAGERWIIGGHFDYRFEYNPIPPRPLNAQGAAQSTPALLRGCSQFIVEYAGDFLSQNADGTIRPAPDGGKPDGVMDFVVVSATDRRIRWYGMPRDIDGNGIPGTGATNILTDVLPAGVVLASAAQAFNPPFEAFTYNRGTPVPIRADYMDPTNGMPPDATYMAAWGPHAIGQPKPQMLRILIGTVPTSPAGDDRIAEYVFSLK